MDRFELDMAFEPEEVAAGLERLLDKLGCAWSCERQSSRHFEFNVTLPDGGRTRLVVRPLPAERMMYIGLFPRTLLEAQAVNGCDLGALRRAVMLAFLRVTG